MQWCRLSDTRGGQWSRHVLQCMMERVAVLLHRPEEMLRCKQEVNWAGGPDGFLMR